MTDVCTPANTKKKILKTHVGLLNQAKTLRTHNSDYDKVSAMTVIMTSKSIFGI